MKAILFPLTVLAIAIPCYTKLTKGYVEVKGLNWEKGIKLSTDFDPYDADILASEAAAPLQVQMDLEKAATVETDIELLNSFWSDIYPFMGISTQGYTYDLDWSPPWSPRMKIINVQQTASAKLEKKENAFTACYPNPVQTLPDQASAIWRYDPSNGGKLIPTFLALNGTRLPAALHGGFYEGTLGINLFGHGLPPTGSGEILEFYFIPVTE